MLREKTKYAARISANFNTEPYLSVWLIKSFGKPTCSQNVFQMEISDL